MIEGQDYELIPAPDEFWHIRILKGDFIESVVSFDKIHLDPTTDQLKFSFDIIFTPDNDVTTENKDLQILMGSILYNLIEDVEKEEK
jgi:translation initiation factor IF-2